MKKTILFAAALICVNFIFAQSGIITDFAKINLPAHGKSGPKVLSSDTIWTYFDRLTQAYNLKAGATGYILGTSTITTETACHYTGVGNGVISDVIIFVAKKVVVGASDNITVKAYTAGADSMPMTLVASGQKSVSTLSINLETDIPLTNQISGVTGDFLVSVEYGSIDDSISLISSNPTNTGGGPDGQFEKRVRQNTSQGWMRAGDIWQSAGSPYNADAMIIPVVTTATGVNSLHTHDFDLFNPFPSPASDYVNLPYALKQDGPVNIVVFDQEGKILSEFNAEHKSSGMSQLSIRVADYASGNYFFKISSGNSSIVSKFSVVK